MVVSRYGTLTNVITVLHLANCCGPRLRCSLYGRRKTIWLRFKRRVPSLAFGDDFRTITRIVVDTCRADIAPGTMTTTLRLFISKSFDASRLLLMRSKRFGNVVHIARYSICSGNIYENSRFGTFEVRWGECIGWFSYSWRLIEGGLLSFGFLCTFCSWKLWTTVW